MGFTVKHTDERPSTCIADVKYVEGGMVYIDRCGETPKVHITSTTLSGPYCVTHALLHIEQLIKKMAENTRGKI